MSRYLAPVALLPEGWARDVILEVDASGSLTQARPAGPGEDTGSLGRIPGAVVPGVVNAHSHAFQRALAGGAETRSSGGDSFWTWREQMYRFLAAMGPADVEAVATQLYVELLRHGYTRVVEFHYLHHGTGGRPYDDPGELSRRLVAAAARAGIGITLVPVLYQSSDFGGRPPTPGQARFVLEEDAFLRLVEQVRGWASTTVAAGFAFHSLRAVAPEVMSRVLAALGDSALPRHIHLAEQPREVEACLAWSGARPVQWILDNSPVDERWHLVHCTHLEEGEAARLAASSATVVVCPTTEANLGDGIFPLARHLGLGGRIAVGSDSHVSVSPVEEVRWLEYGQRLVQGERAVSASGAHPSTARRLMESLWIGGAAAAGTVAGSLTPGARADFVVLDLDHPSLAGRSGDGLLDAWIFSGNDNPVKEVWVSGRPVVRDGIHPAAESVARDFRAVMGRLLLEG